MAGDNNLQAGKKTTGTTKKWELKIGPGSLLE